MCRRLVNCVLPTVPGNLEKPLKQSSGLITGLLPAMDPLAASTKEIHYLRLKQALKILRTSANAVGKEKFQKAIPLSQCDRAEQKLEHFSQVLSKMYFPNPNKHDKLSRSARLNHPMLMWDTFKYSLMSMEIAARCGRSSLTPNYALSAMYEELKSSSGFILSLLLKLVQKSRNKNSLHVLQRFRGVQLFSQSICFGVSDRGIILVFIALNI